jgi:hypothetical protein
MNRIRQMYFTAKARVRKSETIETPRSSPIFYCKQFIAKRRNVKEKNRNQ